ncbi:hypothetical protein [Streptomyces sp. NPDC046862]|uniref:hypothetical protein n=1 Tax=Streptomyces sp. NPDC046862 TaxID=3154603 RepID=UPI003454222D
MRLTIEDPQPSPALAQAVALGREAAALDPLPRWIRANAAETTARHEKRPSHRTP